MSGYICVIFLNNLGRSLLHEFVLTPVDTLMCLVHRVNNLRGKMLKEARGKKDFCSLAVVL